ncbi:MAG: hypothetical protein Ta2F_04080 [Termitinemataceae bacterium]|nr:MAG: hypothetical protein Ta2F_04080 [Termitinemataceae bacterium]
MMTMKKINSKKKTNSKKRLHSMLTRIFTGVYFILIITTLSTCNSIAMRKWRDKNINPIEGSGWILEEGAATKHVNITKQEVVALMPEQGKKSPNLTIQYQLLDSSDTRIKMLISKILYGGQTASAYFAKERYELVTEYYSSNKRLLFSDPSTWETYNWYFNEIFTGYEYVNMIVICRDREYYKGGSHGMREKRYFVIDTVKMDIVKRDEIIPLQAIPTLERAVEENLRIKYGGSPTTSLSSLGFLDDRISLNNNFYISKSGLTFSWDPYDISVYVMGIVEASFSYSQIESLLTTRGKQLLISVTY